MAEYFGDELVTYSGLFLRVRDDDPGYGNGMVVRTALDDLGPSVADARGENNFSVCRGYRLGPTFTSLPAHARAGKVRGLITPRPSVAPKSFSKSLQ